MAKGGFLKKRLPDEHRRRDSNAMHALTGQRKTTWRQFTESRREDEASSERVEKRNRRRQEKSLVS